MRPATAPRVRSSAVITAVLAAGFLALAPAWSASAHSAVVDSTPGEGEVLTVLPESFSVTANEELLDITGEASGFALQVVDADGLHYEQECPVVDGITLATAAAIGAAGDYELRYQFVSADGHAVSGAIPFEWAPEGEFEATTGTEASLCGGSAPSETDVDSTPPPGAVNDGATDAGPADTDAPAPLTWILGIGGGLVIVGGLVVVILKLRRSRDED